jgi:DHA1 family inner membrane transport protein
MLGVVAFIGIAAGAGAESIAQQAGVLLTQLAVLKKPRLLLVYAMTTLGYGGTFVAFTYLAPILQEVAGFGRQRQPGDAGVRRLGRFGNIWGGKLADRKGPVRALQIVFALLAAVLLVLSSRRRTSAGRWPPCWPGARSPSATCRACRCMWCSAPSAMRRRRWTWPRA